MVTPSGGFCARSCVKTCVNRTTLRSFYRSRNLSWSQPSQCCLLYTPACIQISVRNTNLTYFAWVCTFDCIWFVCSNRCRINRKCSSCFALLCRVPSKSDGWKFRIRRKGCTAQGFSRNHSRVPLCGAYGNTRGKICTSDVSKMLINKCNKRECACIVYLYRDHKRCKWPIRISFAFLQVKTLTILFSSGSIIFFCQGRTSDREELCFCCQRSFTSAQFSGMFYSLLSFWLCPREWSQTVLCLSTLQVQHLVTLLSELEPKLADMIKKDFLVSSNSSSWTGPEPLFDNKCIKNCIYGKTCTLQKFAYCTVCISMCLWPRFFSKLNIF